MTDIDFDELDKAVNSLMSQSVEPSQVTNVPAQATPGVESSSAQPSPMTAPVASGSTAGQFTAEVAPSQGIQRRPGRFMDVMTPPRGRSQVPPSSRPIEPVVSREGAGLQPSSEAIEANLQNTNPLSADVDGLDQPAVEEPTLSVNSIPGPVSVALPAEDQLENDLAALPMQSPFLSDVEVDKRPLGQPEGYQASDDSVIASELPDENLTPGPLGEPMGMEYSSQETDQFPVSEAISDSDTTLEEPLGEALSDVASNDLQEVATEGVPDVAGIENADNHLDASSNNNDYDNGSPMDITGSSSIADDINELIDDSPEEDTVTLEPFMATITSPVATGDIPRQYTPEESVTAPEPVGVFDNATTEPTQNVKHPKKKKSGWLIVIWILLLSLIGAGGGAAVWFFLLK